MKTFTQWFVINAGIATTSFFAYSKGLFGVIFENDASYIAALSMVIFVFMCGYLGKVALDVDKTPLNRQDHIDNLDFGWFVSGHFLNLGLLGTVVGFCFMMGSVRSVNPDITETIKTLVLGAGTALYTTLVGLVCHMLLQFQLYTIQNKLKK